MTIAELGLAAKKKYSDGTTKQSNYEIGLKVLMKEPAYWEHIDSKITHQVASFIDKKGFRVSWLGGKRDKMAAEATAEGYEALTKALQAYTGLGQATLSAHEMERRLARAAKDLAHTDNLQDIQHEIDTTMAESALAQERMQQDILLRSHGISRKQVDVQLNSLQAEEEAHRLNAQLAANARTAGFDITTDQEIKKHERLEELRLQNLKREKEIAIEMSVKAKSAGIMGLRATAMQLREAHLELEAAKQSSLPEPDKTITINVWQQLVSRLEAELVGRQEY